MQHGIIVSEWLVVFMGFIILIAGVLIGAVVMGLLWLKKAYKDLIYKLEHLQIEPVERITEIGG